MVLNNLYLSYILDIGVYSIGTPTKGKPLSNVGLNFLKEEPLELGSYNRVCKVGAPICFGLSVSKLSTSSILVSLSPNVVPTSVLAFNLFSPAWP